MTSDLSSAFEGALENTTVRFDKDVSKIVGRSGQACLKTYKQRQVDEKGWEEKAAQMKDKQVDNLQGEDLMILNVVMTSKLIGSSNDA